MEFSDDPYILELLPEFVDTWLEDISSQMNVLIESNNGDDLYRMGHTLKGSCLQFGLDSIASLGIELMGYAREKKWDQAKLLESKLLNEFDKIKKELSAK
ncbi:MAG: Hpt domain-containing protein [Candidatus Kapabacteria bacterium]|nr:Hpt domain-containing protein [Candidatus Kapabacteria bacterium]